MKKDSLSYGFNIILKYFKIVISVAYKFLSHIWSKYLTKQNLYAIGKQVKQLLYPNAIIIFLALISIFILGLWISSSVNDHAIPLLLISIEMLVVVTITYFILDQYLPASHKTQKERFPDLRYSLFWASFGLMALAVIVLLIYVPTTASLELIKHLFDQSYKSELNDVEVRLSTGFMPLWAQMIFAAARRFAAPYCMLEFFLTPLIIQNRKQIGVALLLFLTIFVFSTLDRAIPVFYFAMMIGGLFLIQRFSILKNKYFYMNILGIIAVVVLFKNIQYGEIRKIQFTANTDIMNSLTRKEKPAPQKILDRTTAQQMPSTKKQSKLNIKKKIAKSPKKKNSSPASNNKGITSYFKYVSYAGSSLIERVFLSPIAMSLYAGKSYNKDNFIHWSRTRLFSFFGIGHYVSPFDKGKQKYHDAFPVTLIGDLWRNGGYLYIPFYAVFLGIVLFLIDRSLINYHAPIPLQVLSLFGVLYLFYGNAFNSTSWLMIGGSLILGALLKYLPNIKLHLTIP